MFKVALLPPATDEEARLDGWGTVQDVTGEWELGQPGDCRTPSLSSPSCPCVSTWSCPMQLAAVARTSVLSHPSFLGLHVVLPVRLENYEQVNVAKEAGWTCGRSGGQAGSNGGMQLTCS